MPTPLAAAAQPVPVPHIHFDDHCPFCEQEIPADRLEEVKGRIATRLREQAAEATAQLRDQYNRERAQAEAKAKTDLETALKREREAGVAREQAVRDEETRKRDALVAERLAQAEAVRKEQEEALGQRAAVAELRAKAASEALAEEKRSAGEREAAARAAGKLEAEAASQTTIGDLQVKLTDAEAARTSVVADLNAKIAAEATAKQAAQQEVAALKQGQEEAIAARVKEAREALEKDKSEALLAKDKLHFDERQRWQKEVDDLKRKLDNQKSGELGEGAEIKLHEVLKEAFPGDQIRRVEKGTPGADIIHEVMLNGKLAGKIVYDSKNRGQWKFEYATKLRQDQIAEAADHAVLSTNKFPKDTRELHLHEGVIIACPARVVVLAEMLRCHILAVHELRMSNDARAAKTEKLYAYITSTQCRQLLESIETLVARLEEIDAAEFKAHKAVWIKRGALLKDVLKANGDFRYALDSIIGTAGAGE